MAVRCMEVLIPYALCVGEWTLRGCAVHGGSGSMALRFTHVLGAVSVRFAAFRCRAVPLWECARRGAVSVRFAALR